MSDKPIIFSAPMIDALLRGKKSQTRRIFKGIEKLDSGNWHIFGNGGGAFHVDEEYVPRFAPDYAPHVVGDRLWVREKYAIVPSTAYRMSEGVQQTVNPADKDMAAVYAAGWERSKPSWKSPMFMPRWASRITLIITDVRVQRLQEISEDDAVAEGVKRGSSCLNGDGWFAQLPARRMGAHETAAGAYRELWDDINAKRGFDWDSNPWVVAYSFGVVEANIDSLEAA